MESQKDSGFEPMMPSGAKNSKESIWDLVRFILIAIAIVLPVRMLIAQPFIVSGNSMFPTFEDKQYLIVDQVSYRFDTPKRGDVVIFRFPLDPSKFFIKRLVGLPNEKVEIRDGIISITNVDGETFSLDEPYLETVNWGKGDFSMSLKDDEYFVMGDNRSASSDSRSWGVLPRKNIVGRAFLRLLPTSTAEINPGEYRY